MLNLDFTVGTLWALPCRTIFGVLWIKGKEKHSAKGLGRMYKPVSTVQKWSLGLLYHSPKLNVHLVSLSSLFVVAQCVSDLLFVSAVSDGSSFSPSLSQCALCYCVSLSNPLL